MTMTKTDRDKLMSIVRNRYRILKGELDQRKKELLANLRQDISERYATEDKAWSDANTLAREVWLRANREVNDIFKTTLDDDNHQEREYLVWSPPRRARQSEIDRYGLESTAVARIEEQIQAALLRLKRSENELLERILVGGLESAEAREFLDSIPTVGELVPASRLVELVGPMDTEATDG